MLLNKLFLIAALIVTVTSCNIFKNEDERIPIARVNENYLYEEDLSAIVLDGMSKTDSTLVVQSFINKWATQQLLVDGAQINLSETKQENFKKLVTQYRKDLLSKAYLEALVYKNLDTVVSNEEAELYYNSHKDVFKLNEELVKFRYIHVDKTILNFETIKSHFKHFTPEDQDALESMTIQFKSYSLNDSIWVRLQQVVAKIPPVNLDNKNELLKKSNFIQLKDSLGVYLMQIKDVLKRNETAPLAYVRPTIHQIVINKRKLEFIKKLEKDITKDAIKNKQFEIYN